MRQEGEPSVEEILESIKQVIARDNRDTLAADRKRRAPAPVEPVDADEAEEVLDLSEAGEVLGGSDMDDARYDDDDVSEGSLLDEVTESSMRDSLAALAMLAEPGKRPQIVRSGETSLEGMVREMLRPMLKEWLDANLPSMVEKMVAAEIARIAGKGR
ncbi:DUF2497 domain-containing protein [Altererythrobacter sp. CAU 1778]